jgi:hypothetical protein
VSNLTLRCPTTPIMRLELPTMLPLRRVVAAKFLQSRYNRPGSGLNKVLLECGHIEYRKASLPVPNKCRCYDCFKGREVNPRDKKSFDHADT